MKIRNMALWLTALLLILPAVCAASDGYMFNASVGSYSGHEMTVVIPDEADGLPVVSVSERAFTGNEDMLEVICPDTLKVIGEYAFAECVNLQRVTFGDELKIVGEGAFEATALQKIELPDSVQEIYAGAFRSCYELTEAVLPDTIISVPDYCFFECVSLREIRIPNVETIGESAFTYCVDLENVTFDGSSLKEIKANAFEGCVQLKEIRIPSSVITIGAGAFADCEALEKVWLPSSVRYIAEDAFDGCDAVCLIAEKTSYAYDYAVGANLPVEAEEISPDSGAISSDTGEGMK